jgi:hypothetical protein
MNDNRKPGMYSAEGKQLLDELHRLTSEAIVYWRHVADDERASEGQLRDHLRQTASVVEKLVESHKMQHEMIVRCRRGFYVACGIVALWTIAFIVRWI